MPVIRIKSIAGVEKAAKQFLELTKTNRIVAFTGEMGAGKTTFIKALCKLLGVENMVNSPSFPIVNEYKTDAKVLIYHFDFYRIKNTVELLDIGIEEYFSGKAKIFIEWPEKALELLPPETIMVKIIIDKDDSRTLEW
ncbi:MAG: tRNA (adenosine(37)-N6)-threonylcarbamoyltransferase complex ATPase subunit type 1 TsaE [Bacteroidales bacterium]|nr:tRNA (adenosine(37)-N6)-threonylcarbamoyltransferase complex ATPase subunit type 1 TsaE [Bacteroidales bacterium]HOY38885.1 tRNA (adenosine(37)-N6)-threonylcarbamoyltransferase complex ATPase subunit type 1 TsaE [Bacteroidales bacterium]HQP04266.1 tRNA (adenosine(37)-N6)-threonylcarbamoyltransferase complex ATPase subunit type 1 TsaE [Bacteroidales bacterium]